MTRTRFVVFAVLIAILAIPIVAEAQSIGNGFGITMHWIIDKAEFSSLLTLKDATTAENITSSNGVIRIQRDHAIIGQINFSRPVANIKSEDFEFSYSTAAAPARESDWQKAVFDPRLGWVFSIDPALYVCGVSMKSGIPFGAYDTPLKVRVTLKRGRTKSIGLVFFKIPIGHSDIFDQEVLAINTFDPLPVAVPVRQEAAIDPNFLELKRAVEALDQNDQVLADGINATNQRVDTLEARMTRMEGAWTSQATPVPPPVYGPPPPAYPAPAYFAAPQVRAQLEQKYAGRTCFVFYSTVDVTRSFWIRTARGWIRSSESLTVRATEENCWNYDYNDVQRRGWIACGLGIGNAQPAADAIYQIDGRLQIKEVR